MFSTQPNISDTALQKKFQEQLILANGGNAAAQYKLGIMYRFGRGVVKSDVKAVEWYQKSAAQGNGCARCRLGYMYAEGLGGLEKNADKALMLYQTALENLLKEALEGDADAQFNLGFMYEEGRGVAQSDAKAVEWYQKAANQGDASAQCNLGLMYAKGRGVAQSDAKAVEWFQKAADQGDARAQFNLGCMYEQGRGVVQSDAKAVEWFQKAANQGDAGAQFNLGCMYTKGQGVAQSDAKAVEWFQKAANQGDAGAQFNLGCMYEQGRGIARDLKQAFEWYKKAALQGNDMAQWKLGCMYSEAKGVEADLNEAIFWHSKAAAQQYRKSIEGLETCYTIQLVLARIEAEYIQQTEDFLFSNKKSLQEYTATHVTSFMSLLEFSSNTEKESFQAKLKCNLSNRFNSLEPEKLMAPYINFYLAELGLVQTEKGSVELLKAIPRDLMDNIILPFLITKHEKHEVPTLSIKGSDMSSQFKKDIASINAFRFNHAKIYVDNMKAIEENSAQIALLQQPKEVKEQPQDHLSHSSSALVQQISADKTLQNNSGNTYTPGLKLSIDESNKALLASMDAKEKRINDLNTSNDVNCFQKGFR